LLQDDVKLLIDYLTVDQQEEMEILRYEVELEIDELMELSVKISDAVKNNKKVAAKLSKDFDYKARNPKILNYFRSYIACSIKDWKGIINADTKEPVRCDVEDNKLTKESLWLLARMPYDALSIYSLILQETEFNSNDKKKSNSAKS
jgi:hypothetical protein